MWRWFFCYRRTRKFQLDFRKCTRSARKERMYPGLRKGLLAEVVMWPDVPKSLSESTYPMYHLVYKLELAHLDYATPSATPRLGNLHNARQHLRCVDDLTLQSVWTPDELHWSTWSFKEMERNQIGQLKWPRGSLEGFAFRCWDLTHPARKVLLLEVPHFVPATSMIAFVNSTSLISSFFGGYWFEGLKLKAKRCEQKRTKTRPSSPEGEMF